jgi:succinyl-CoA synthetase beta subunit
MHLTGDRARELLALALSRDPPGAPGGPARFAPPGTPPVLSLCVGVDPDSLAPGVDLRAGSRRARVGADLDAGPSPALLRESLSRLGAPEAGLLALGGLVLAAWRAFLRLEATEIHTEAMLTGGDAVFGACALRLDPRALFRHPEVESCLADTLDRRLARAGIDYVGLDGDVGILCIGAGMTLSMIDRLRDAGARPAAFLDVSRNISADGISLALGVLLDHHRARVIAVNVFGGITPMDHLARGLVEALARRDGVGVPLVARLEGTGGSAGRAILEAAGIALAADTAEVIAFAVRNTGGGGA